EVPLPYPDTPGPRGHARRDVLVLEAARHPPGGGTSIRLVHGIPPPPIILNPPLETTRPRLPMALRRPLPWETREELASAIGYRRFRRLPAALSTAEM